jgi:hypothetical protein
LLPTGVSALQRAGASLSRTIYSFNSIVVLVAGSYRLRAMLTNNLTPTLLLGALGLV